MSQVWFNISWEYLIINYITIGISTGITTCAHASDTESSSSPPLPSGHFGYKLVGDNIDMVVKARYVQVGVLGNRSLHYFHFFAVKNRVDFILLPDVHPDTCLPSSTQMANALLPSANDDKLLRDHFVVHVSRILSTYLPYFKFAFEDVVEWHMNHKYSSQMSQKSEVVSTWCYYNNGQCINIYAGTAWNFIKE